MVVAILMLVLLSLVLKNGEESKQMHKQKGLFQTLLFYSSEHIESIVA
jgi:hypothetical protein